MTIHKKPVEEKEHDSEKYRFMKEQVRPQQKKNAIKYAQKAVSVIVLALIFGSAAGAAFYFVQSRYEKCPCSTTNINNFCCFI